MTTHALPLGCVQRRWLIPDAVRDAGTAEVVQECCGLQIATGLGTRAGSAKRGCGQLRDPSRVHDGEWRFQIDEHREGPGDSAPVGSAVEPSRLRLFLEIEVPD